MKLTDFMPLQILWTLTGAALTVTAVMSLIAYAAFAHDKAQARSGGWRVPEQTLLWLAIFGGWPGAKIAQRRHRHKTRKEPFRTLLNAVGVLQGGLLAMLLFMPEQRVGEALDGALQVMVASATGMIAASLQQGDQGSTAENPMPHRFGPGSADW
ncbi:DUF1294 domain-containing protein [Tabrizicola sp.]|uniref:DUF1294 domain-containing protein n=1 Tax=Tabrizicola sp. TaxID=2005166 RepID=UPI003F418030